MGTERKDETGNRYGRLTVLRYSSTSTDKWGVTRANFLCKCDCGNEIEVPGVRLRRGNKLSCGCLWTDKAREGFLKPLEKAGDRFGKLLIIREIDRQDRKEGHPEFLCRCDCGNEIRVLGYSLRKGRKLSCGCARKKEKDDARKKLVERAKKLREKGHTYQSIADIFAKKGVNGVSGNKIKWSPTIIYRLLNSD